MAYTQVEWVAGVTPLSEANMDHLETQYDEAMTESALVNSLGIFGDASDGDVTTAGGGAGDATLTRDMFYDDLTITAGDTITTGGFRIFVAGTLTNNGTIERNGNAAVGVNGGVALADGSLLGSLVGGDGGVNAAGSTGNGNTVTGSGGAGGAGGAATAAGGAGGAVGVNALAGHLRALPQAISAVSAFSTGAPAGSDLFTGIGGSGGGGGGDATPGTGGGGGGAGALIIIAARIFDNSGGTVESNGGAGANGVAANGGGGGGGGGGTIVIVSNNFTSGTEQALAGALGTGNGTGANGVAGSAGLVIQIDNG